MRRAAVRHVFEELGRELKPSSVCKRVNGKPCVITPNEVRQLLASGNIEGPRRRLPNRSKRQRREDAGG